MSANDNDDDEAAWTRRRKRSGEAHKDQTRIRRSKEDHKMALIVMGAVIIANCIQMGKGEKFRAKPIAIQSLVSALLKSHLLSLLFFSILWVL